MSTSSRAVLVLSVTTLMGAPFVAAEPPPAAPPAAAAPAAVELLPTDPAIVSGSLDNGLAYRIRKHANPPGRAVIWIHMDTGSLNETERQRGIAHYLEHMAFNGSENFPPGSVVPFFQSLGMTFGRDQNAFTSREQTTFQLSLPDAKPETLGKGLTFFADVLHRLLLTPKEIESERQIIQEERRSRLSGRQRTGMYVMERIAPGSLFTQRETIGTEASIDGLTEKDFHDYYGTWYAASNATLMVVADAEPADVVKLVKEKFGDAPKRPKPVSAASGIKAADASFAIVATDPELNSEDIEISRFGPARPPTTTVAQLRDDLVIELAESALNRRLEDKVSKGAASYLSASVSSGNQGSSFYSTEISGRAGPGKWKAALEGMALELQRARVFGFTAREIDDAKRERLSGAELAVATIPTAQSLITRMNGRLTAGEPVIAPADGLALLKRLLPAITREEVAARFAQEYEPKAVVFVAVLPAGPNAPTEAQLLEIGTKALEVKPTEDVEVAHATKLMAELPKPGELKESDEHAATGVWSGWLGNNVRVHQRSMDTRKDQVSVTISLVGGELLETADNRGITSAAQIAFGQPATKSLSSSDVRDLMVGKKVSVRGSGGGRRGGGGQVVSLTISGSPTDLETGFQLAHLLLTEPRIEATAFAQFQTGMRQAIAEAGKNPLALGIRIAGSVAYPDDDVRMQPTTAAQIDHLTVEAAQAWLEKLLGESPIEVAVVGDLGRDRALELVTHYLGSLPARPRVSRDTYLPLRTLKRPAGPRLVEKTLDTPTAQAFVLSGFYGADETNLPEVRALNLAAQVLSTRMIAEIREQAQLVYSIGASSRPGGMFPGFGVFAAGAPTEPHKADALVAMIASMYEKFAASGPTDAELDVAKKQVANTFGEQLKDPSYWMAQLEQMTLRGQNLDDLAAAPAVYQAFTVAPIKDVFAKYYAKANSLVVVVKPKVPAPPVKKDEPAMGQEPGK